MGSAAQLGATGQGSIDLGDYRGLVEIDTDVVTPSDLWRVAGTGDARRIYQIGHWAIATLSVPTGFYYVSWDQFIEHDHEAIFLVPPGGVYGTHVFYDLEPGAVVDIAAYWP